MKDIIIQTKNLSMDEVNYLAQQFENKDKIPVFHESYSVYFKEPGILVVEKKKDNWIKRLLK